MSLATLNDTAVTALRVQLPSWGVWYADVTTERPLGEASGTATLVVGDATLSGTIVSGGDVYGRGAYRVAAGAGAWGTVVPARAYRDDSGVQAATVIRDAAQSCGESIAEAPARRLGPHYTRRAAAASSVLHDIAPRGWYVGADGGTRIGLRSATTYEGTDTRTDRRPDIGTIDIATQEPAALVPGVIVDGAPPASDVEWMLSEARLTVRVYYAPAATSRRLEAYRELVRAADPRAPYRGVHEYRVVTQSGERLSLQPIRTVGGMPELEGVPVRLAPGIRAQWLLGSPCLVAFVDADPSRPVVIAGDAPDAPGWMPLFLRLGEDPVLGVARITDPVIAGPWAGTITGPPVTRIMAGV